eukprot:COSAG02_NODE_5008_length_4726_cov_3.358764_5_plen_202_part_00
MNLLLTATLGCALGCRTFCVCVCVLCHDCSGASTETEGRLWQRVTGGTSSTPGRFDAVVVLRGTDDASSESEEDDDHGGHRGTQWTQVGKVYVQFELLPQALANARSCGHGRSAPNQYPELPPPVGRVKLSLNPLSNLSALVGPDLARNLCVPLACIAVFFILFALNQISGIATMLKHFLGAIGTLFSHIGHFFRWLFHWL